MAVSTVTAFRSDSTLGQKLRQLDSQRLQRYARYQRWYDGQHWEWPRNGRTNLTLNYARAVVDKGVAYLLGRGLNFAVPTDEDVSELDKKRAERAEELLYDVYWDNDLDTVDLQVAQNAGTLGDGVYKVFWDLAASRIRVVDVHPSCWFVTWAADDPGVLLRAETVYSLTADQLEQYALSYGLDPRLAGLAVSRSVDVVESWTVAELAITVANTEVRRAPNPYGFIPFVHVPNFQPPAHFWGVSDLLDVIPINRELNERVSDQADIIRYHADPPVIFRGVTDHEDLAVGPGTVWDIPVDAEVRLLEWQGQPPAVQAHIEAIRSALFEVSETPRTAFGDSGRLLSGVALETELRPIIQKTLRRQRFWNRALRQRNRLILRLAELYGVAGARAGVFAPYRTRVIWPPMVPKDDAIEVQNNVQLVAAQLRSHTTAMDALGEQSPEQEKKRILADRAELGVPTAPGSTPAREPERPPGRPRKGRAGE